jgi:multidrug resistance efflux pump
MEILLLGIYSFFAWLVFFKFKWLPWNITSQVITITIPIIGITALILFLNIAAPSSPDVRVMNYVVPNNPRVAGKVIEVPVEPNKPVKKGDVLFKIDPVPFQIQVNSAEANLTQLRAKLVSANANARNLG